MVVGWHFACVRAYSVASARQPTNRGKLRRSIKHVVHVLPVCVYVVSKSNQTTTTHPLSKKPPPTRMWPPNLSAHISHGTEHATLNSNGNNNNQNDKTCTHYARDTTSTNAKNREMASVRACVCVFVHVQAEHGYME